MIKGCIFNIQRYSLHDGGGIRTMVFLKGCPFHCPWCCNPESLSPKPQEMYRESLCINCSKKEHNVCKLSYLDCPTGAKDMVGEYKSVEEVFDIIQRDVVFYEASGGGVTISGGECLMQEAFTIALLKKCKEANINTAIETTLATNIQNKKELVKYTNTFLVDFKMMDEEQSKQHIGISMKLFQKNIHDIIALGGVIIARIPLVLNYTTHRDNLMLMIELLKKESIHEVHLLPFHKYGESKYKSVDKKYSLYDLNPLGDEEVKEIETLFKQYGFNTTIGGN